MTDPADVCAQCGVAVADRDRHSSWHDEQAHGIQESLRRIAGLDEAIGRHRDLIASLQRDVAVLREAVGWPPSDFGPVGSP